MKILLLVYGENDRESVESAFALIKTNSEFLEDLPPARREKKIKCYHFMSLLIEKYHTERIDQRQSKAGGFLTSPSSSSHFESFREEEAYVQRQQYLKTANL